MKTNIVFFVCDCTGHAVGVEREDFDDEPVVCISYWQRNPQQASFWARLKDGWTVFRGHPTQEVLLSVANARRFAQQITEELKLKRSKKKHEWK